MSQGRKPLLLVMLMSVAMLVSMSACRRKPTSSAPTASPGEQTPAKDHLPTAPTDSSLRFPIQQELTGAIHLYQTDFRKLPPDFETLVKGNYLKVMPTPPPGKRFAVDRNRLQVVVMD